MMVGEPSPLATIFLLRQFLVCGVESILAFDLLPILDPGLRLAFGHTHKHLE